MPCCSRARVPPSCAAQLHHEWVIAGRSVYDNAALPPRFGEGAGYTLAGGRVEPEGSMPPSSSPCDSSTGGGSNADGSSSDSNRLSSGKVDRPLAEWWLQSSATQMTAYGLQLLHSSLGEGEFAVLFHASHFATLVMHSGALYALANDYGYLHEPVLLQIASSRRAQSRR